MEKNENKAGEKLNLKEKIKQECIDRGIPFKEFLEKANIKKNNFYGEIFRGIWKERIAAVFDVDEEEFFRGFEDQIHTKCGSKQKFDYSLVKPIAIEKLEKEWISLKDISQLVNINARHSSVLLESIRYSYVVDFKIVDEIKMFHISEKIDKSKVKVIVPIEKLPKKVFKGDLLTWGINHTDESFNSSTDLVNYAKLHDKQIYERNTRGEVYYL
jgi:hypothetical protein